MQSQRGTAILLALALSTAMALGVQGQGQSGDHGPSDDGNDTGKADAPGGSSDQAKEDHPAQGRALGRDGEWSDCRDNAENETEKQACLDAAMQRAIERQAAIKAAREEGRVGGELHIAPGQSHIDNETGVEFEVEELGAIGDGVRIQVGAELDRGQTIILDVDPEMLNTTLEGLLIEYYDVADDGSESRNASFSEADSMDDVLNPDDDEGAEYWIIEDHEGYHVMVSIPTWSVHSVTLTGQLTLPEGTTTAVPIVAVSMLIAAFVVMGFVVWWQRPGKER